MSRTARRWSAAPVAPVHESTGLAYAAGGLAAAHDLARLNYDVSVFEASTEPAA